MRRSSGRRRARSSRAFPEAAGSTSRTRRSTGTPRGPRRGHVALRCSAGATAVRGTSPTRELPQRDRTASRTCCAGLGVERGRARRSRCRPHPGALRRRARHAQERRVFSPLFSAFGPEPIRQRLAIGDGRGARDHRRRSTGARWRRCGGRCPTSSTSCSSARTDGRAAPGTLDLRTLLRRDADRRSRSRPTDPEDLALLHFTSGTTGTPKGAVHVHEAVVAHHATGRLALDLHPDDVFWCTADPGLGHRARPTASSRRSRTASRASSTRRSSTPSAGTGSCTRSRSRVWYTAPTAIRMLMRAGAELAREHDLAGAALPRQRRRAAQPRSGRLGQRASRPARSTTTGGRPRPAGS